MAAVSGVAACSATLSGTTADTVTLTGGRAKSLAVTNRDDTTTLYFTVNGDTAVAAADETFAVLPEQTKILHPYGGNALSVVGNDNAYTVEAY